MRKKLIALSILCILVGFVGITINHLNSDQIYTCISPSAYGLPLSSLWKTVLENAGVENETAVLQWLYVKIDRDGRVEHIVLQFSGTFDGEPRWYQVEVSCGKVRWHSWKAEKVGEGLHPLTLFKEIEKLNLREIPSGENGITIDTAPISGSVGYEDKYSDIYLLKNGVLIRLKRIIFDSDIPWYPIGICKREKYNASVVEANRIEVSKNVVINLTKGNKENQCIVIFIPQDLSKAKVVEYREGLMTPPLQKLEEVSRQHPIVKKYLEMHPSATYYVEMVYLTSEGLVYQVDEQWRIKDFESVSSAGKPADGKDHYCWVVHWHDPTPGVGIDHIVVYIDRDTYDSVFVQEG
ncbi:MAG: hypothetical protein OD814_000272 [Candidatus Alkanophagales archaeon MCA70_species_1]|nr:hypothetical protein [Candidatus Alkanophaga volatiphilum]